MFAGVEVYLHAYLSSTLDGSDWIASRSGRIFPLKMYVGISQNNSASASCNHAHVYYRNEEE